MKALTTILLLSYSLLLTGCASSGGATDSGRYGDEITIENTNTTLDQYIKGLSGVSVYGSGSNATVQLRGSASGPNIDSRALFVVDGIRMGKDFSRVYNMVNMSNVVSVNVIRGPRATVLYGGDGSFGAIEIKTKSGS